ncbi:basic proline-rich protein-like [Moschus berezovskii]|uniref:basic proline-rich protein-like n=1 Tax=Moschus berezovskii TaxID=68408 RepID=UPI0024440B54|nr:basic proline-rich protein-like [Moschus berezovskii]
MPPAEGGPRGRARLRGHAGRASGQERRGGVGAGPRAAAQPGASAGRRAPAPSTPTPDGRLPACLPACCLPACPGAAHRASRQGRRCSRRVGSQPAERPRARPGPPSGWPSGLRRCVQVAVSPGGVGSNPTPDKPAFWPSGQTHPSSARHCLSPHTLSPRHLHPTPGTFRPSQRIFPPQLAAAAAAGFPASPPPLARPRAHPPTALSPAAPEARSPATGGKASPLRRRCEFCQGNGHLALAALLPRPPPAALPPAGTLSSAPAPPARLRSPANTPRRPSPPALPAKGVLRALDASPPCGLGRATRACLPAFLPASDHRPSVHESVPGRVLRLGGRGSPACPSRPPTGARPAPPTSAPPRPFAGEAAARAGAKPALACSLPQPAVPEPGAALPKGPPPQHHHPVSAGPLGSAGGQSPGAGLTRLGVPGPERRSGVGWGSCGGGAPGRRAARTARARRPGPRPLSHAPPRPGPKASPPEGLRVGARPQRPRSALQLTGIPAPGSRRRLPAPSGDTDSVAAAVVGAEGAGRAEWARVPPPRGPARARILAFSWPARRPCSDGADR